MSTSIHSAFEAILLEENGSLRENNIRTCNKSLLNFLLLFCFEESLAISSWFIDFFSKINS